MAPLHSRLCRGLTALVGTAVLLIGCRADESATSNDDAAVSGSGFPTGSPSPTASADSTKNGAEDEQKHSQPVVRPISVLGLAQQRLRGDRLRTGRIREQTTDYTSYNVRYRSRTTTARGKEAYTITGVLNVPRGRGPFPAVVLAHGYIEPTVYVRGQGMSGSGTIWPIVGTSPYMWTIATTPGPTTTHSSKSGCDWDTAPMLST